MLAIVRQILRANWQKLLSALLMSAAIAAGAVILVAGWAAAGYIALPTAVRVVLGLGFGIVLLALTGWLVMCSLGV